MHSHLISLVQHTALYCKGFYLNCQTKQDRFWLHRHIEVRALYPQNMLTPSAVFHLMLMSLFIDAFFASNAALPTLL